MFSKRKSIVQTAAYAAISAAPESGVSAWKATSRSKAGTGIASTCVDTFLSSFPYDRRKGQTSKVSRNALVKL